MSGKATKHENKMKKRRAEKAAKKAAYLALAGTSKKRKRMNNKSTIAGNHKHAHVMSDCGNLGCNECYPRFAYIKGNGKSSAA